MLFQADPTPRLKCVLMAARLYAVDGHPNCYYRDGRFYRWHDGILQSTSKWNGRWKKVRCELLSRAWSENKNAPGSLLPVILGRI